MAITQPSIDDGAAATIAETGGHGGRLATILSAMALGFSGISFYLSALQGPGLEVYVPPTIHYARDGGGDIELFAIPVTIVNDGARTGTVLSIELDVENVKDHKAKRYYSAFLGEHPRNTDALNRQFAPLSIPGRGVFAETVRFYPAGNPLPKLVEEAGEYRFRLKLNTATPPQPSLLDRLAGRTEPDAVIFQMTLPWLSEQQLDMRRATISMHAKDWKPTFSASR
jgi:hypothetical protein